MALRDLGGLPQVREAVRDVRTTWFDGVKQDVRYGCCALVRSPRFSAVLVLTLAIGIGASTAIFSGFNAVLLRPLPYPEPDRLAMLWTADITRGLHEEPTAYQTVDDWRNQSRLFADMAIFRGQPAVILGGDAPDRVLSEFVSPNLFSLLGVLPALGRTFTPAEQEREEQVVVLSHGLWQRRFGGSRDVIGRTLTLAGRVDVEALRVIGVMPAVFAFPNRDVQFWRPASVRSRERTESRLRFIGRLYGVVGRLRPRVTLPAAQAEMTTIGQRLAAAYPSPDSAFPGFGVSVVPMLEHVTGRSIQSAFWIVFAAVGVVLLMACVNAANLLLARGAARARELAVRTSLGAGRARLFRQLLTETLIFTLVAAGVGLAFAYIAVRSLARLAPAGIYPGSGSSYELTDSVRVLARSTQPGIARLDEISIDAAVLGFTLVVMCATTLLFGLLPAWKMSRTDPNEALKRGASSVSRVAIFRRAGTLLIVAQCALAFLLLAGAGLLIRSSQKLHAVEKGYRSDHVLLLRVSLAPMAQRPDLATPGGDLVRRRAFYNQVREQLHALPGVRSTGVIGDLLVRGSVEGTVTIAGRPAVAAGTLGFGLVGPGFFETLQVPLRRGRFFTDNDVLEHIRLNALDSNAWRQTHAAWRVVVNDTFVRRFLSATDPIGTQFSIGRDTYEIVGVAGDMRREGPEHPAIAEYFTPYIGLTSELAVRTTSEPMALAPAVRQTIQSIERGGMVLSAKALDRRLGELSAARLAQTWLLTAFATVALTLAVIGIYGIMRYAVAAREHEIAVRIALGARRLDVFRLIVGEGMIAPIVGATIGLMCALWLTALMSHLLFEIKATDPATFAGGGAVLAGAALAACWLPARRASRVDPIGALRCD